MLKRFEIYGYRLAYYLLEDERLAIRASVRALKELWCDDEFFRRAHDDQMLQAKRVFVKHALREKSARHAACDSVRQRA